MRLRVNLDVSGSDDVVALFDCVESDVNEETLRVVVGLLAPDKFRALDGAVKAVGGKTEVITHAVKPETVSGLFVEEELKI